MIRVENYDVRFGNQFVGHAEVRPLNKYPITLPSVSYVSGGKNVVVVPGFKYFCYLEMFLCFVTAFA